MCNAMHFRLQLIGIACLLVSNLTVSCAQDGIVVLPVTQTRFGVIEREAGKQPVPIPRPKGCDFPEVDLVDLIADNPKRFNLLRPSDIESLQNARSILFAKVGSKMERVRQIENQLLNDKIADAGGQEAFFRKGEGIAKSLLANPEANRIYSECDIFRDDFRKRIVSILSERSACEDVFVKWIQSTIVVESGPAWALAIFGEFGPWKSLFPNMDQKRRDEIYLACQSFLDKCDEEYRRDFHAGLQRIFEKVPDKSRRLEIVLGVLKRDVTFDSRQFARTPRPSSCVSWLNRYADRDEKTRASACVDRKWIDIVSPVEQKNPLLWAARQKIYSKYMAGKAEFGDLKEEVERSFKLQADFLERELGREFHPVLDSVVSEIFQDSSLEAVIRHPVIRKLLDLSDDHIENVSLVIAESDAFVRNEWKSYALHGPVSALSSLLTADELRILKSIADGSSSPKFMPRLKMQ